MNPFSPFLEAAGVVILDGGLGSELERLGADIRDPLWSAKLLAENPDLIRQVHEHYFTPGPTSARARVIKRRSSVSCGKAWVRSRRAN